MSRFYFHIRPMWSLLHFIGGALIYMGFEHTYKSGLLLGADLAPAAILYPMLGVQGRARIGYGGPSFAIGAGVGGGAGTFDATHMSSKASYVYAQVGGFLRLGRLERTYAELSVYVAVPQPYPFNALFHLSARTSERWRYKLDIGVEMMVYGPYLLMGGERRLHGNGGRDSSAINFGLGLVFPIFVFGIPGPMLSIGYERRF